MPRKKADTEAAQLGILHYSDNLRTLRPLVDYNLDLTAARGDQFNVENDVAGGPGVDLALPFFRDLLSDNRWLRRLVWAAVLQHNRGPVFKPSGSLCNTEGVGKGLMQLPKDPGSGRKEGSIFNMVHVLNAVP
ncbi:hypothetical protein C8J56DRAFT_903698 [Mycena floridula]|nr:hypothetical protein C8J56DRAFT_903698 [Mycena floridula]